MAQTKFNFSKAVNFFSSVWNVLRSGGKMFVSAVIWVWFFIMALFLYNPLTMFLIHLFSPKTAARFCCKNTIELGKWFKKFVYGFYSWLAKPWPYHWKKHWMGYGAIVGNVEEQLRYYDEYDCSLGFLTEDARCDLWNRAIEDRLIRKKVFTEFSKQGFLDDDKFCALISGCHYSFIWNMLEKQTPSKERVAMLINQALFSDCRLETSKNYKTAGDENAMKIVLFVVRRNGLDCDLISSICACKKQKAEEIKQIEQALDVYAQKIFTGDTGGLTPDWKAFCENTPEICPEAQKLMDHQQYAVFLDTDHHLDASAIAHFFKKASQDDDPMVQLIMSKEPDHGVLSDEIDNIIKSKSILFAALMSELSKK